MLKKQICLYLLSAAAVAIVSPAIAGEPKAKVSAELPIYKVVHRIAAPDGAGGICRTSIRRRAGFMSRVPTAS